MSETIVKALKKLGVSMGMNGAYIEQFDTVTEILDEISDFTLEKTIKVKVKPVTSNQDLFGKTASDLQSNIDVAKDDFGDGEIKGTLAYVSDYTGFSSDPDLQKGNFIALQAINPFPVVITAELIGGTSGPVTLDEDGIIIFRIANNQQVIKFESTMDGVTSTSYYHIENLVLTPEEQL